MMSMTCHCDILSHDVNDLSLRHQINSTRRCAVFVDPRATDTAYRLNYHIIWTQAVVIRLCEVIRPAHCLTLLSPQRLILIS